MNEEVYTEAEALDVAAMLFIRKMRRLAPEAYAEVIGKLPTGAMWALNAVEHRGDATMNTPEGRRFKEWPMPFEEDDEEE